MFRKKTGDPKAPHHVFYNQPDGRLGKVCVGQVRNSHTSELNEQIVVFNEVTVSSCIIHSVGLTLEREGTPFTSSTALNDCVGCDVSSGLQGSACTREGVDRCLSRGNQRCVIAVTSTDCGVQNVAAVASSEAVNHVDLKTKRRCSGTGIVDRTTIKTGVELNSVYTCTECDFITSSVNERLKVTRFQRLILTRLLGAKAPRRTALI